MSANLLQNPGKIHTFTDDLESFLHVLGWMTLRYVPSSDTYDAEDRRKDMVMFDELSVRRGRSDSGGDSKSNALGAGRYPSRKFRPRKATPLFELLQESSRPFKSLYGEPPSDENRMKIDVPKNEYDDIITELSVDIRRYDREMEQLRSSSFFINVIQKALDKNDWPTDDMADANLPIALHAGHTDKRARIKTSQLQNTHSLWENSKGLSRSSKRAASPTPEPSTKRRRGTPAASESQV